MKTTLLAWATVFEVLNFQQRRVLGHHIDVGMASPLTYGRDNLTPLQVSIHAMIQKISLNIWDPDAPRAQRLDRQIELEKTLTDLDKTWMERSLGLFALLPLTSKSLKLLSKPTTVWTRCKILKGCSLLLRRQMGA